MAKYRVIEEIKYGGFKITIFSKDKGKGGGLGEDYRAKQSCNFHL